ncbi:hypothetical protein AVEN_158946-1 [Araneus ventricosus]|uniref:non-specific serine/threonine protein kinase n=1 Tax=Araneus ventricosus TaxID=182803 RepID=A0A4Y2B8Y2_ARAVE|nr:hypothetical protein AVEN_158946-1 [Araneus ventricosus]
MASNQRLQHRFLVLRKLGQGTYGKVQLALNKETNQEVAIKTIKKAKIENEEDMLRIRREIHIMTSIRHPHIIHIHEDQSRRMRPGWMENKYYTLGAFRYVIEKEQNSIKTCRRRDMIKHRCGKFGSKCYKG